MMLMIGGVIGRRERVESDYSFWLGPNYPIEWDCGMYVTNHISPLDVCIQVWLHRPRARYMGKREALAIPLAKGYTYGLDFLTVGRDTRDSKEVRQALIAKIEED